MALRQGENDAKQLGLFFFAEPDAEAMVEKVGAARAGPPCCSLSDCAEQPAPRAQIREQNPKLAKQTRVLKVTVDKASAPRPCRACVAHRHSAVPA